MVFDRYEEFYTIEGCQEPRNHSYVGIFTRPNFKRLISCDSRLLYCNAQTQKEFQILDKYVNPCLSQTGMMDYRQPSLRSYQREGSSRNFEEYQQFYTPPSYSRDASLPIIEGNQQYYTTNYSRGGCTRVFQENQHEITASYSSKHVFPGYHHVYALSNHCLGEKSVQSYSSNHPQPFPPNHPRDQILLPTIYHGNHPSPMVRSAGGILFDFSVYFLNAQSWVIKIYSILLLLSLM